MSFKLSKSSVALTTGRATSISIICNVLLALVLIHAWSEPCEHGEETHNLVHMLSKHHVVSQPVELAIIQDDMPQRSNRRSLKSSEVSLTSSKLGSIWAPPAPSELLNIKGDLSTNQTFSLHDHEYQWQYCSIGGGSDTIIPQALKYCPQTAEVEQKYQMSWFGTHVVAGSTRPFPKYIDCIHLPPAGYQWPAKWPELPAKEQAVHWQNLRVQKPEELIVFNRDTPKNLYHFDAPKYDLDALNELDWAAKYIPFGPKVRLMLDVGAGGGSLGLLMKRKYDVQVLSTVFADWPYCEYISERGGLCMLVDVMEPMPFAKFTYDVLHVSWVYHGQQPDELLVMFNEINRVLRPGGYLWMRGGWSRRQVDTLSNLLLNKLGYQVIIQNQIPKLPNKVSFGEDLPYELDWDVIFVKPIAATPRSCNVQQPQRLSTPESTEVDSNVNNQHQPDADEKPHHASSNGEQMAPAHK